MSQNVCIYFSDTGGGHRSAAEALDEAVRLLVSESGNKPSVAIIKDSIAEKSHPINRQFVELYNYLLRHHQPLMKYYYSFLHMIRPESGFNYALTKDYFTKLLQKDQPSIVVSVHPMIHHCLAHAMKELGIRDSVKLVVVITDPNADLWRAWACEDADLIIAPNDVVHQKLSDWNIPEEKIETLGMPVHPDFLRPPTIGRQQFLTHLGLSPNTFTLCINAGWAGGGNMLEIYKALSHIDRPMQVIFLCGHNTALYEKAMAAAAESDVPTAVLPFHDKMSDLMANVDMMVTKAGGLTTYQAMARRLPLAFDVLTEPMPQERGTIDMLVANNIAWAITEPTDIIEVIDNFEGNPDRLNNMLPEVHDLNLTDTGIYEMAKRILAMCNPPITLTPAPVPVEEEQILTLKLPFAMPLKQDAI